LGEKKTCSPVALDVQSDILVQSCIIDVDLVDTFLLRPMLARML